MKINELRTPCYVIDEGKLTENLLILNGVMRRTGARILLAQKAFSAFYEYPLIGRYLSGTDRKSTRLNSSHTQKSRMPSSA